MMSPLLVMHPNLTINPSAEISSGAGDGREGFGWTSLTLVQPRKSSTEGHLRFPAV